MSLTKNDLNQIKELILESEIRLEARFERKFATKDDLKNFATKDDLKNFATKDDLKNFATKDDLKNFPTKTDLRIILEGFVTKEEFLYQTNRIINMLEEILASRDYVQRYEFEEKVLDLEDRIDSLEKAANPSYIGLLSEKAHKSYKRTRKPKPASPSLKDLPKNMHTH